MAFEFKLPDLGEGIHEAQIIGVKVKEGDTVTEDQPIMEVETDKAAVEIPVPRAGRVAKLMVKAGDTVKVGQVLIAIEEAGKAAAAAPAKVEAPARAAAPAKAEAPARQEAPRREAAPARSEERVERTAAAAVARMPAQQAPVTPSAPRGGGPVPATPVVRRLAREMGIDLRLVSGSGPGGRILREDLERVRQEGGGVAVMDEGPGGDNGREEMDEPRGGYASQQPAPSRAEAPRSENRGAPPAATGGDMPDFTQWGPVKREPAPQIRKAIARQMMRAWQNVPRVTHGDEVDLTDLEAFRKQHGETIAKATGGKLTVTAFMLKALAASLVRHPKMNCSYDGQTDEIIWKQYVHIGVAVDTPRGLIVPVLRDVDRKSLAAIAKDLTDLSARIRDNKFDIAELRGGTFTLSNVGALGGTFSTPMVNYPETAILVTGKMAKKPVVKDDQIVIRSMMPLCVSFDHRIIDGADAARFTKTLMEMLENPVGMLMTA